jgi:hypothetical protein
VLRPLSKKWTSEHQIAKFSSDISILFLRETLDGLRRVGFKMNRGHKDCGVLLSAFTTAGGYYLGTV